MKKFFENLFSSISMGLFSIVWVMRIDPKDPNAMVGQNMMIFTHDKTMRNAWLADGISLRHFGYHNCNEYVRVKWYFPCVVLLPRRNRRGEVLTGARLKKTSS